MNVLAIDTAGFTLAVCLQTTDNRLYAHLRRAGLTHSEMLMPVVAEVLSEGSIAPVDLGLIVCSKGPGSFTGLRIGMATAKGLAKATSCPLISVSTMAAMAQGLSVLPGAVVPVIDAKKQRVYAAVYKGGLRSSEYLDIEPAKLAESLALETSVVFTGPDRQLMATYCEDKALWRCDTRSPAAYPLDMIALGLNRYEACGADAGDAGPLYVRRSDAEISFSAREASP